MNMDAASQTLGIDAQLYVKKLLRARGFSVKDTKYNSPFDLLCDGKRIEVKISRKNGRLGWFVNIHRHGKLHEEAVDVYVILLDFRHLGKRKPLILLRKAPIGRKTLQYSLESLLTIHNEQIENWEVMR